MKKLITIALMTACIFTTHANDIDRHVQCITIESDASGINSIDTDGSGVSSIDTDGSGISSIDTDGSGIQQLCQKVFYN